MLKFKDSTGTAGDSTYWVTDSVYTIDTMRATEGEVEDSLDGYLSSARSDTTLFSLYFDSSLYWDAGTLSMCRWPLTFKLT